MKKTLEKEFENIKMVHMYSIVKAYFIHKYIEKNKNSIDIPYFLKKNTPEELADEFIEELINEDSTGEAFYEVYQNVWDKIKETLP